MGGTPVAVWSPLGRLDPLCDPEDATLLDVNLQGDSASVPLVIPPGMILGEITAVPGLYGVYNHANSDGSNTGRMINQYLASVLGASGAVGAVTSFGGEWPGVTWTAMPAYKSGDFDLSKLWGLESTSLADMYGRVIEGALGVNESDSLAQTGGSGTWGFTIPSVTIGGNVYPAVVIANTALSATVSAASFATTVNAALLAAGWPATVTATGGALGSSPIVAVWHGILGGRSFAITLDNSQMSGGTVANTRTAGVAAYGVVRFG